jgi:hypothetical protein
VVQRLPSMREAPVSIPAPKKRQKKKNLIADEDYVLLLT